MTHFDDLQARAQALLGGTPVFSAPMPTALDLDAVFATTVEPAKSEPQPVHRVARQRESDPRIMAWGAFKAAHPFGGQSVQQRQEYARLSLQATRARTLLRKHPALVAWYAQRELLASLGQDPAGAGPSPLTAAGKAAARAREQAEASAREREHVYLMTCDLPDPTLVRVGERSPEAAAERYALMAERRRIEAYRAKEYARIAPAARQEAVLASDGATPQQRRLARTDTPWEVRVQEDELFMALEGLVVRCHTHTQNVPMIRRRHRATA